MIILPINDDEFVPWDVEKTDANKIKYWKWQKPYKISHLENFEINLRLKNYKIKIQINKNSFF